MQMLQAGPGSSNAKYSNLRPAFDLLPQGACTCNLGPETITPMHRDAQNLSYGLCAVSVFGAFDWENGAELLLLEPGVIVQLGPGEILLFPSAAITHGNFPLSSKQGQVRYSLTSYTSGSLFQWLANGRDLVKNVEFPADGGWDEGWGLYTHVLLQ